MNNLKTDLKITLLDCPLFFHKIVEIERLPYVMGVHVGFKFPRGRLSVFVTVGEGCPPNKRPPPLRVMLHGTIPNNDF